MAELGKPSGIWAVHVEPLRVMPTRTLVPCTITVAELASRIRAETWSEYPHWGT